MKKVGIITLHRVVNYGSVLQTYALQKKINELGYDATVIDYYPNRLHIVGMLKRIKNKGKKFETNFLIRNIARIIIFPSYIMRFNIFKSFLKKYIKMTNKTYYKDSDFNNSNFDFDVYCTGSDQVWNSSWNEKIDKPVVTVFADDNKKYLSTDLAKDIDENPGFVSNKIKLKNYEVIN